jgi:hypothetical protein
VTNPRARQSVAGWPNGCKFVAAIFERPLTPRANAE